MAPPIVAAFVEEEEEEEDWGAEAGRGRVEGVGVEAMVEVRRMMDVAPLGAEDVDERVWVVVLGGGVLVVRSWIVVAGFGGREIVVAGFGGVWELAGGFEFEFSFSLSLLLPLLPLPFPLLTPLLLPFPASLPPLPLLPLLFPAPLPPLSALLLPEPWASAGPSSDLIVAVGFPLGRLKKMLSSFRLQHTFDASRFWSQQYCPPLLEHCCTAWLPESLLSRVHTWGVSDRGDSMLD